MKKFIVALAIMLPALSHAGTYTPTATDVAHASTSSVAVAKYYVTDGIVHIAGSITVASDDSMNLTEVLLTLPVSSALTNADDCHGTLGEAEYYNTGSVSADAASDKLKLKFLASISDISFAIPLEIKFSVDCEVKE